MLGNLGGLMRRLSGVRGRWLAVLPALLLTCLGAEFADAQTSIGDLVTCLNNKKPGDISNAATQCLPQGCKITVTMSTFSAQPACNLESTQLPRVILNCPGTAAGLRFRPSFTLCTANATRIEVGQDVLPVAANGPGNMQMADIGVPAANNAYNLADFLSTMMNDKKCNGCHSEGPAPANANAPFLSVLLDSYGASTEPADLGHPVNLLPYIIQTTEPNKIALVASLPNPRLTANFAGPKIEVNSQNVNAQTIGGICTVIGNTLQAKGAAAYDENGETAPLQTLCQALAGYQASQSCGNNGPAIGLGCHGITGGGLFRNDGVLSSVSLDFSGQTTLAGTTLTYDANKIDATMLAFNYADPPGTQVNTVVLNSLVVEGGNTAAAAGTATIKVGTAAAMTAQPIMVTISVVKGVSSIMIASLDGKTTYAGGTATGTLFQFN
jgi:hypothetical protein